MSAPKFNTVQITKPATPPSTATKPKIVSDGTVSRTTDQYVQPRPASTKLISRPAVTADSVPSNWFIQPGEEGKIIARNTVSGNEFEGTNQEFNAMLRG